MDGSVVTGRNTKIKLSEVCRVEKGKKPEIFDVQTKSRLPYLGAKFLRGTKEAKFAEKSDRNSVFITEKDLVIICDGSKSGDLFSGFEGVLSSTMGKIVFDEYKIEKKYLELFLQFNFRFFNLGKRGAAIPHLDFHAFNNLEVLLPSLAEQKKIVAMVEKLLAKVKEATRFRTEARVATQSLLSAELHKIFEEGKKNGWEEKELKEICQLNPKKSEVKDKKDNFLVSFVPMSAVDEYLQQITLLQERLLGDVNKGYTYFCDDDVLLAKITPCMENGKIAIARNLKNGIGFGTTEFHVVRSGEKVLPEWIYYILRQPFFREDAKKRMTGSAGQKRVPVQFLETYKIPLPPLAEQKKIVVRLDKLSAKLNKLEEYQKSIDLDLARLEQSILHEAFSGGL